MVDKLIEKNRLQMEYEYELINCRTDNKERYGLRTI